MELAKSLECMDLLFTAQAPDKATPTALRIEVFASAGEGERASYRSEHSSRSVVTQRVPSDAVRGLLHTLQELTK